SPQNKDLFMARRWSFQHDVMRRDRRSWATSRSRGKRMMANRSGSIVVTIVIAMVVVGLLIGVTWFFLRGDSNAEIDAPLLSQAKRDSFEHVVIEQGEVESSSNVDVVCEIKSRSMGSGGVAILWVIDEGARVKKGERLVELDASALEQEMKQQRNVVNSSLAAKISAEALLQQAIIAKQEYLDGTFTTEEKALLSEIAVAEQDLRKAKLQLQSAERLAAKGLVTSLQLEADQFAVRNAMNVLDSATGRLAVLRELTKKKMLVQFDSDIETAKANVESQTKIHEEELDKLADLEDQITKCVILAPDDGVVVHANKFSSRGSAEFVVEAGSTVRERQTIVRLPDPTKMQVKAKVNESQISLIKEGMPVQVKIGASDGEALRGRVTKVNKYAEPNSWFSSQVKEFATTIAILDPPSSIRTGMTAEVRIMVDHQSDALQIPVQAVHEHRGHTFCLVKNGTGYETREIEIGASNDKAVTIANGLSEGDMVAMNPRRHLDLLQLPEIADTPVTTSVAFTEYQQNASSADSQTAGAARGPSGGAPGERGPGGSESNAGGGPPNPEQMVAGMFQRMDTNGDGQLSADELPAERRDDMLQSDTNGDGMLDRAEMTARMRARFASGGGGGPGGPRGGFSGGGQ
ncbi:MAG: efflux RND transporter periplasmic adaptor subunit, partial [Planctomycetales bacterium]|nr:efflux RND transporter periplasmic adaptor subunit [Planctomycetales bacterium]